MTGATGKTGRQIVRDGLARDWQVRAATRRPTAAGTRVRLDWDDETTWQPAFAGSAAAYVLIPFNHPTGAERTPALLEAVHHAGVERIVLLSSWDAQHAPADSPLRRAERTLARLPVRSAVLRPTWFMDNFTTGSFAGMIADGRLRLPAGEARIPFIDVRDVAAVAVAALAADGPTGVLPLTGPAQLDHHDVATALSAHRAHPVVYEPVGVDEFVRHMVARGFSPEYGAFLAHALGDIADGRVTVPVSDVVEGVTGRPPRSITDFARHHAAAARSTATGT